MNVVLEKITGMDKLSDQVIAYDFLNSAKTGVRNYAIALTETATPEVEAVLRKQLEEAVSLHENISNYMIKKGWYHPYNVKEQINLNLKNAQIALNLAK